FALFLTLPYSKFVHGIYRYLALVRYARERFHHFGEPEAKLVAAPATTGQGGQRK
ncbi:hypothetical protein HJG44_23245, partial [Enterovirga sp. DB1703]|nr:hypothetical protein [Enterovirga sp. DB1703]